MSYQYSVNERRRRQVRGSSPSFGHIRTGHSQGHQSSLGVWVPLALTVGAAAVGIAAWIWSERRDGDEGHSHGHGPGGAAAAAAGGYGNMSGALPPGSVPNYPPGPGPEGASGPGGSYQSVGAAPVQGGFRDISVSEQHLQYGEEVEAEDQHTLVSRVSHAFGVGRSASPAQKTLDWAGKKVSAGVAAAGAMAGAAMKSMGMSGEDDAERWSEEADSRLIDRDDEAVPRPGIKRQGTADEFYSGAIDVPRVASVRAQKRTTVAVVVSAFDKDGTADALDHASILAHLPEHIDRDTTRVLVLIYAPDLKVHPLQAAVSAQKVSTQSLASSYSNISQRDADADTPAQTPGEFPDGGDGLLTEVAPRPIDESSPLFKTLYNQAVAVVETETNVLPFTTNNGHKHILKSLGPEVVYIQESLCGAQGELVTELSGWVRQIVVVIGDEGGAGGLVDTEDDDDDDDDGAAREKLAAKWWSQEERTGLGKRVAVVEGVRIGDDWDRRLNDKD